jgi:hypothetical protein
MRYCYRIYHQVSSVAILDPIDHFLLKQKKFIDFKKIVKIWQRFFLTILKLKKTIYPKLKP